MDYKKPYTTLFNGITEIIEQLQKLQIEVEEEFLQMGEERNVVPFKNLEQKDGCLVVRKIK